jgi:hypothetical protein
MLGLDALHNDQNESQPLSYFQVAGEDMLWPS